MGKRQSRQARGPNFGLLAREYGLPERTVEILEHASPLHDLGKIAVPDAVLNKPGKLDPPNGS